jgi:hypothetical protein
MNRSIFTIAVAAIVTDGAPRTDGHFTNRAAPVERVPPGVRDVPIPEPLAGSYAATGNSKSLPRKVGASGFEPPTSWSRSRSAPDIVGKLLKNGSRKAK